jgi:hypothetical protein
LLGAIVSSRFGPESYGRVSGLFGPIMLIGAVGPDIPAAIRDGTGSYDLALLVFLAIIIPSACAMAFLRPVSESGKHEATE